MGLAASISFHFLGHLRFDVAPGISEWVVSGMPIGYRSAREHQPRWTSCCMASGLGFRVQDLGFRGYV